ncbi:MAG: FAD-binding and (Fe-S)-binding domain-containing protein [Xenococcaceae cyanobacterium]
METFVNDLKQNLRGEVRFGEIDRVLYSTDASFYQIKPLGVVIPLCEDDIIATVEHTRAAKLPVLPRGGGTSLAGQTVGEAVVIDCSKYMNRVLELNLEEGWAWVEPGLVQDAFKGYLQPHGLRFAPETSTSSRATIGGMCGNNSAGPRSIVYGKTIDHILACKAVLSDGSVATFGSVSEEELKAKSRGSSLEAQIYRKIPRIVEQNREEILARYPKLLRRVSGYNLDALLFNYPNLSPMPDPDSRFNLAKLLVGSEGTLGIVTALKVRLVPNPRATALGVVHFHDVNQSIESVNSILELNPAAVELVDDNILEPAARSRNLQDKVGFLKGNPAAILIVEFHGENQKEVVARVERLEKQKHGYHVTRVLDRLEQSNVWAVRKAGLGMLMSIRNERKPLAFVEDPAVPVEHLPEFLREFQRVISAHQTTAGYYGHASVGCLHIRPALNLKQQADIDRMKSMLHEISDLTLSFGGCMSGEHGDGLARGWLNKKMYGSQLYEAFGALKGAFDFENRMNPGKIVDCPPPDRNLRYGTTYQTINLPTTFDFSREFGIARSVEMCNGNGTCRKDTGTMCPSYQATREEKHSTRGRANALRAVLSGQGGTASFTSKELYDVMDLCLLCKSCQTECPSSVNMAKLKAEFLSHYHDSHGTPLRDRIVGKIHLVNRLGSATAPLSNWLMKGALGNLGKQLLGFAPQRQLPAFSRERFSQWFAQRTPLGKSNRGQVVLFHDTYMEYNTPSVGQAATKLLESLGYEVILPKRLCCSRPAISKGLLREAQSHAHYNIEQLLPYAKAGIPIVGCEPSCILTLRDEYIDLVPTDAAKDVAEQTVTIDEFLNNLRKQGELNLNFKPANQSALVHSHCHQKTLVGTRPTLEVLSLAYPTQEIDSGCCGMAGSFGYEKEHYELSLKIGSQRLFPAIEQSDENTLLVANGISCRQQIAHATGRTARHLVEILADAL